MREIVVDTFFATTEMELYLEMISELNELQGNLVCEEEIGDHNLLRHFSKEIARSTNYLRKISLLMNKIRERISSNPKEERISNLKKSIESFIETSIERGDRYSCKGRELYGAYRDFCVNGGMRIPRNYEFGKAFPLNSTKSHGCSTYKGIRVRNPFETVPEENESMRSNPLTEEENTSENVKVESHLSREESSCCVEPETRKEESVGINKSPEEESSDRGDVVYKLISHYAISRVPEFEYVYKTRSRDWTLEKRLKSDLKDLNDEMSEMTGEDRRTGILIRIHFIGFGILK